MYLGGGCQSAMLLTHLAERVSGEERGADLYPVAAVAFLSFGIATVAFVLLVLLLGVFFTETVISKLRAAGVGAGSFRFVRRMYHHHFRA